MSETREERMPVVFVGHGSPMNAIEDNRWSRGFTALGQALPRPRAILAVSAHWFVGGTYLTAQPRPETIHDFGGFPPALHEVQYPAPGQPELARRVRALLAAHDADARSEWGLDHGTWSVLRWMVPEADVPVIQLSLDRHLDARRHMEIGRALAPLRDEGVLILGSGNIVHNLRDAFGRMRSASPSVTPDWARRFDADTAEALRQRDGDALLTRWQQSDDGRRAHPTPEHWLPLLYAYAASADSEPARFAVEGFDAGSISMRSVVWG
ncbi:MAG: 4,5-DOPA dioxygenase extradiol [Sandaracinaceae bacterium]